MSVEWFKTCMIKGTERFKDRRNLILIDFFIWLRINYPHTSLSLRVSITDFLKHRHSL